MPSQARAQQPIEGRDVEILRVRQKPLASFAELGQAESEPS